MTARPVDGWLARYGWWLATDGRWYPPGLTPGDQLLEDGQPSIVPERVYGPTFR